MELQKINPATAIFIKEKGIFFDNNKNFFTAYYSDKIGTRSILKSAYKDYKELFLRDEEWQNIYQFPTQELLGKYLRENHNLIVDVCNYYDTEQLPLTPTNRPTPRGYFFWDGYNENFKVENAKKHLKFEDAYEEGLQTLLKYI